MSLTSRLQVSGRPRAAWCLTSASALPCFLADPRLVTPTTDPPRHARWVLLGGPSLQGQTGDENTGADTQGSPPSNPTPAPWHSASRPRQVSSHFQSRQSPSEGLAFCAKDPPIHLLTDWCPVKQDSWVWDLSQPVAWEMGRGCEQNQVQGAPSPLRTLRGGTRRCPLPPEQRVG